MISTAESMHTHTEPKNSVTSPENRHHVYFGLHQTRPYCKFPTEVVKYRFTN